MTNCINWNGAVNSSGYPVTWQGGKTVYAHRAIIGAKKGEVVRHSCDNPRCVNPKHLFVGTHKDNSDDMVNKSRQAKGSACGNSKLTEEDIPKIRLCQGYWTSRQTAFAWGISKTNVLDIWNRKIWRHI